jgi:hypothetical protein
VSTNSECLFIETSPGKWYYVLEDYNAPKNSWDWRENASCAGPFSTEDAAYEHMQANNANPGSSSTEEYTEGDEPDEIMQGLIENATKPRSRKRAGFYGIGRW